MPGISRLQRQRKRACCYLPYCLDKQRTFGLHHTTLDRYDIVGSLNRDFCCSDGAAVVIFGIHQMNGGTRHPLPVVQYRLVHVTPVHALPAISGQQRRVNIQDPPLEGRQGARSEFPQVPRENYKFRAGFRKDIIKPPVSFFFNIFSWHVHVWNVAFSRIDKRAGAWSITYNHNGGSIQIPIANFFRDGPKGGSSV